MRLSCLLTTVANGYALYDRDHDGAISEFKYMETLLNCLNYPSKEVYCAAAEVCGIALLQQANEKTDSFSQSQSQASQQNNIFEQLLRDKVLSRLISHQRSTTCF